ncbi:hypothetical protein ACPPVU_12615 [Mucilaginibacter sp. McL0603]
MRRTSTVDVKIDKSDSSSFGSRRFSLVIVQNPDSVYRLLDFNAGKV